MFILNNSRNTESTVDLRNLNSKNLLEKKKFPTGYGSKIFSVGPISWVGRGRTNKLDFILGPIGSNVKLNFLMAANFNFQSATHSQVK